MLMETLSFDFGTDLVRVTTRSNVSLADWEKIYETCNQLIQNSLGQLDALNPDSVISKLNIAKPGVAVDTVPLALDYLDTNLSHYLASKGQFNPFGIDFTPEIIELNGDNVVKVVDFKVQNHLLTSFVLDLIDDFLQTTGLSSYLISTPKVFIGRGDVDWQVAFEHPAREEEVEAVIRDSSIILDTREGGHKLIVEEIPKAKFNPFSNKPTPPTVLGLILQHKQSQTQAQILSNIAMGKSHELEVKPVLKEVATSAWVLGTDGNFKQILPV